MIACRLQINTTSSLDDQSYDALVFVGAGLDKDKDLGPLATWPQYLNDLKLVKQNHTGFDKDITFIVSNNKRVVRLSSPRRQMDYYASWLRNRRCFSI